MLKRRKLTQSEQILAKEVFADSFDLLSVTVTNVSGLQHRAFTVPGGRRRILCNLGRAYDEPITLCTPAYPVPGQLLVHELTHAWQIANRDSSVAFLSRGIGTQLRYLAGTNVYAYGEAGRPWSDWNLEQQASIVDQWFAGAGMSSDYDPQSTDNPYYRYIRDNIRASRT